MKEKSTTDATYAQRQLEERYRERQQDLRCVLVDLKNVYDRVLREELYWCTRDKGVQKKHTRLVKDMYQQCENVCCRNKRTICRGSWTPPSIRSQPFPVCHKNGCTDGNFINDIGRRCSRIMWTVVLCKREKDVLEVQLEQWWTSWRREAWRAKSKARVHVFEWNTSRNYKDAIRPADTGDRIRIPRRALQSRCEQEDTMWLEQLEAYVRGPTWQEDTTTC